MVVAGKGIKEMQGIIGAAIINQYDFARQMCLCHNRIDGSTNGIFTFIAWRYNADRNYIFGPDFFKQVSAWVYRCK